MGERSKPLEKEITIDSVSSWSAAAPAVTGCFPSLRSPRIVHNDAYERIFPFKFHKAPFKTKKEEKFGHTYNYQTKKLIMVGMY